MTYFLGCDVSKAKLDISLVNAQNVEQWVSKVANDEGSVTFQCVSSRLGSQHYGYNLNS